jgi:hypothetical protein
MPQHWVEPTSIVVTALATVILAIVTYLAVKGGDRTARAAERTAAAARRTLDLQTRPALVSAHRDDPPQHIVFHYGHRLRPDVAGGMAVLQDTGKSIYMGIALHNIGRGMAVLYGWHLYSGLLTSDKMPGDFGDFAGQRRALHIPPKGVGYWQAQAREKDRVVVRKADATGKPITVDLLYGNEAGWQGQITRFHLRVLGDHRHGQSRISRFLPRPLAGCLSAKGVRSCEVASRWSINELEGSWPEQLRLEVDQATPGG